MASSIFTACGRQNTDAPEQDKAEASGGSEASASERELEGAAPPPGGEIMDDTQIRVFADRDCQTLMTELIEAYGALRPTVFVDVVYDSADNFVKQLQEQSACDVLFSAKAGQLDELTAAGIGWNDSGYRVVLDGTEENSVKILEASTDTAEAETLFSIVQLENQAADELERNAAWDFVQFLVSDTAKEKYENYSAIVYR